MADSSSDGSDIDAESEHSGDIFPVIEERQREDWIRDLFDSPFADSDGDDENDNFQGFHDEWIFNEFFPHIISIIIYKYCIKVIIKYTVTKIIQLQIKLYLYAYKYNFINQYFIVI